jgi:cell division protein FtsW
VGFGESRQKYHYLGDTAFTDTIFAIFAEEFGLFGCVILVLLFLFVFLKGYRIAMKSSDRLGFLLAVSITTWLSLQAVLHIGANVALIPINGNTLPFLSYGGSSTIINLTAIGILLNISKGVSTTEENKELIPFTRRDRTQLQKFRKRR